MQRKALLHATIFLVLCVGFGKAYAEPRQKEWTFLVFLNGHNNLSRYGAININQMEQIGSTDDVNMVVQWGETKTQATTTTPAVAFDTRRLYITKDSDQEKVTSPVVETMPPQDFGDYKNLIEFVRWASVKYPAKRYFVSYWNHGAGWLRKKAGPNTKDISYDDVTDHKITTEEMGIVAKEVAAIIGHKVDIVGADACLMAMAEVASEMVDSVDYFVASEDLIPGIGWPYHKFLARMVANPKAPTAEISKYVVEEYIKDQSGSGGATLSAIRLESLPAFWNVVKAFGRSLSRLSIDDVRALKTRTAKSLHFAGLDYADVGHWVKTVLSHTLGTTEQKLGEAVQKNLPNLVTSNGITGSKFDEATGVAIWAPLGRRAYQDSAERFKRLRFAQETHWDEVVDKFAMLPSCKLHPKGQFSEKVIGFSTEYSAKDYAAREATGSCDTEEYGDKKTAWCPKVKDGGMEFLSVGFTTPVHSTGAVIRENSGAGSVTKIEAIDTDGNYHQVWAGRDPSVPGKIADWEVSWPRTDYLVSGLKITVNTLATTEWEEIDSVTLIGDETVNDAE